MPSRRRAASIPNGGGPPLEVYVNGVRQAEGKDYLVEPGAIVFTRALAKEGKVGFWRWTAMALNLFGTYRPNDSVDIHYTRGARREVAVEVPFEASNLQPDADRPDHR